ncbi:MAG TPA: ABC transporter permease, partial [Candidatus Limnocylindrales bacterium]|nr:ABC transporter permease [Candidatus Limnocylindrales bacterium]
MRSFRALSLANLRSFLRDRAALFWTLAFPVTFVILFGTIFSGSGTPNYDLGWVDQDGTPAAAELRVAFDHSGVVTLHDGTLDAEQAAMKRGDLAGIIVVPSGLGAAVAGASQGASPTPVALTVYTDPTRTTALQTITQVANAVVSATNLSLSGKPAVLAVTSASIQTEQLSNVSYFVPSILAMALMQLGVFAAIPLVQQREKLILKRLFVTPLPRWTLVASNIVVRLVLAAIQTALIVGIGVQALGVQVAGNWLEIAGLVALGAVTFVSIGYVLASFARTEEAANGMTSIVQFPLMFLSGIFFPLEILPTWLRGVATVMPLTYLGDALRQVMV